MRDRVEQDEIDHDIGAGQWEPLPDDWERYEDCDEDITGAAMTDLDRMEWAVDFLKGQSDCAAGKPHVARNAGYDAGYAAQYEWEQIRTERTK